VFFPKPNVASALVDIKRRTSPAIPDVDPTQFFTLVRTGFGQRRKMLRRVLAGIIAPETFTRADVSPEARAEELDVHAWGRLCVAQQVKLMGK
jgi:16S rRNA (adenine1518-N6/adenine1519-N6)-dimethyltransferase